MSITMPDNTVKKPTPVPLRLPWMVSPSTPFLRLVAVESAAQGETYVEFVAYNQREDVTTPSGTSVRVVQPPEPFRLGNCGQIGPYRLVRMVFKSGIWARMCPAYSDTQTINEAIFDWSHDAGRRNPAEDIFEYLQHNRELWQQSGICPTPRVYEVESSVWLNETGSQDDGSNHWKHYLILGHDSYVEVIAEGYEILEGQVLAGW